MNAAFGRLGLATAILALWGFEARAASVVVIGNLPQTNDATFSAVAAQGGTFAKAVGFTMGADSYLLESLELRLKMQPGATQTSLSIQLYSGETNPSLAPLSFNTPTIPTAPGNVTFTPTSSFHLQPLMTYWIYASGVSNTPNGIVWYGSDPGRVPTGVGATAAGALFSNQVISFPGLTSSSLTNSFQVLGQLDLGTLINVPEPASLVSATTSILAGLAFAGWRRRARRLRRLS
jgi:hypothetical protein